MNSHRGWGRVQPGRSGLGQLLAQPERLAGVTAVHVNFPGELRSREGGTDCSGSGKLHRPTTQSKLNEQANRKRKEILANWKPCFSSQLYSRVIKPKQNKISAFETKI